jgi:hypothetical protein
MRRVGLGVAVGGGRVSVGVSEGSGVSLGIRDVSLGATVTVSVWMAVAAALGAGALQATSVNDMTSNRLRTKCNLRDMSFLLDEK